MTVRVFISGFGGELDEHEFSYPGVESIDRQLSYAANGWNYEGCMARIIGEITAAVAPHLRAEV